MKTNFCFALAAVFLALQILAGFDELPLLIISNVWLAVGILSIGDD